MAHLQLSDIQKLCRARSVSWREHALLRMKERHISRSAVKECIYSGEIIEHYPQDFPVPSCLIVGMTVDKQYIHVVCSIYEERICIITAYYPDSIRWESDLKTRKAVQ